MHDAREQHDDGRAGPQARLASVESSATARNIASSRDRTKVSGMAPRRLRVSRVRNANASPARQLRSIRTTWRPCARVQGGRRSPRAVTGQDVSGPSRYRSQGVDNPHFERKSPPSASAGRRLGGLSRRRPATARRFAKTHIRRERSVATPPRREPAGRHVRHGAGAMPCPNPPNRGRDDTLSFKETFRG